MVFSLYLALGNSPIQGGVPCGWGARKEGGSPGGDAYHGQKQVKLHSIEMWIYGSILLLSIKAFRGALPHVECWMEI